MAKKTEKTVVEIRPDHMQILALVGVRSGITAEELGALMAEDVNDVLQALDELINCGVLEDEDAAYFELTGKGEELFQAFYNAIKPME